jgi:predicted ATPase
VEGGAVIKRYVSQISLKSYPAADSYLHHLPVVRNLQKLGILEFYSPVVIFVGENGTGKSTLLEALAVSLGFNPEGGTRNFNFSTRATHSELYEHLRIARTGYPRDGFFLRAESFYNVATNIEQLDEEPSFGPALIESYGGVSLHKQSHGESFLALVQNRFGGRGLYILDEPEAALSPSRQMTLLAEMHALVGKDSQFIVSTHSPILLAYPGAQVIELTPENIRTVPYKETEHFKLTKQFLNEPERMLKYLLEG